MNTTLQNIALKAKEIGSAPQSGLSFVHFFAPQNHDILLPQTNLPYIYFILSGSLTLSNWNGDKQYASGEYFISCLTTPLKGLSSGNDFLAVSVEFLPDEIISVLLEMDNKLLNKIFKESSTDDYSTEIQNILNELLNNDKSNSFLSAHFKRELIFYLLIGKYGNIFIQNTFRLKDAGNIYNINSWIKENYKTPFSVKDLAKRANMSVSGFHQKFKNAVGMGPIQCQKKLRLIEARKLMLRKGLSVTEASMEVGYESLSQFNRDYRQIFGETPKKDINNIQNCLKIKGAN